MVFLTYINKRYELRLYLLQFFGIFLVSIFQMLESTTGINIVARVDAYLLAILCSHISGVSSKVDIGYERRIVSVSLQTGRDMLHILCLPGALRGETNQFTTGIDDTLGLRHAGLGIIGIGSGHRLDTDRIVTTYSDIAHMGHTANSSCSHI